MKRYRFLWIFIPLMTIITSLTFMACGEDINNDYTAKNVIGYWSGNNDTDAYTLDFYEDMTGEGRYYKTYNGENEYFSFRWSITGDNQGRITVFDDVYNYDDDYLTFDIKTGKMYLYLNNDYYNGNSKLLCILYKE